MIFARHTGQPLDVVLAMHPRDMDTWLDLDAQEASEHRLAQMRAAVVQHMRGG